MEVWTQVDLTDQCVGVHDDLNWGDPTCEEGLDGHKIVNIRLKSSHEGYAQGAVNFKDQTLEERSEKRLHDYDIEFRVGKIVCTELENIAVFACETGDDEEAEE